MPNDINILLSIINTKLRDFYKNLDDLCDDLNMNKFDLLESLERGNYYYNKELNQFVQKDNNSGE